MPKILYTNIITNVWQTVRKITNEILGVKGLITTILLIKVCVHPN